MADQDYGYLTYASINNLVSISSTHKSTDQQSSSQIVSTIISTSTITQNLLVNLTVAVSQNGIMISSSIIDAANTMLQSLANPTALNNPTAVQPSAELSSIFDELSNSIQTSKDIFKTGLDSNLDTLYPKSSPKNDATKLAPYMKDYSPPEGRLGEAFGNVAEKMFKSVSIFGKNMVSPAPNATGKSSGIGGAMMGAVAGLGAMIPQMAALSIVTQPLRAFLEGLMSPFEILNELFGAFGEVLGTAFMPVMIEIVNAVIPFLPIVAGLAQLLAPLILFAFKFLTPLGLLITIFQGLASFVPPDVAKYFTELPTTIMNGMSAIGASIMGWVNGLPAIFVGGLITAGNAIGYWFSVTLPNFFSDGIARIGNTINEVWETIGTNFTGGGADHRGWW